MVVLIALQTAALISSTFLATSASARPAPSKPSANPAIPAGESTTFDGQTYINKGLVGFGVIPPSTLDSTGLTLGGLGSAAQFQKGSWKKNGDSYSGVLITQPDRGHNTANTVDFQARQQYLDLTFTPYYGNGTQAYSDAIKSSLLLKYKKTLLYTDLLGTPTTGLDPLAVRPASLLRPALPIPASNYNRVSVDAEGLVVNKDGSYWVSDEYGPYVYHFSAWGQLLNTVTLPKALLPYKDGKINFTSETQPDTGRSGNQGFEGLTTNSKNTMLWALLQSATVQDGGAADKARYTRLVGWDISFLGIPRLTESYVLELPVTNGKGKTLAASDLRWLSTNGKDHTFMILSRDGKGMGDDDSESKHKDFLLATTKGASNIVNTPYTTSGTPVAPNSVLVDGVTAIEPVEWIDMIDDDQLARFGLQNGGAFDETLISSKWEAAAFVPALDSAYPDDYFLFAAADNDFITKNGVDPLGVYSDAYGKDIANQFLVWRVTVPSDPGLA